MAMVCLCAGSSAACSEDDGGPEQSAGDAPRLIELDPGKARLDGKAQDKCWAGRCYWVVWCGHNICDGAWRWQFPASGNYEIIWKAVSYKCAGAPPYELRVNGEVVRSGRLEQYGSCKRCTPGSMDEVFRDTSLGQYALRKGDEITPYVKNDFACGIDGPGAYAAFRSIAAERRD